MKLYIPDSAEGVIPHTPIKPSQPIAIKIPVPKDPPAEVLKRTFSVEQMPETEPEATGVISSEPVAVGADGKAVEVKPKIIEPKPGEPFKPKVVEKEEEKKEEEKKEEEVSPLKKFLKPPVGKEEKGEKKKEELPVNYADFTPDEVSHLKKMDNTAKVFVAALIKENKSLAKTKDSTFLQHPQAYVLDPGYQGALQQVSMAKREAVHWSEQLENAKSGRDVQLVRGFDNAGNLVMGDVVKSNDPRYNKLEEALRQDTLSCLNVAKDIEGKIQGFVSNFQIGVKQGHDAIMEERKNRFEWQKDPKLQDYSIECPDGKDRTIKEIRSNFISVFPAYLQQTEGVEVAADLMVSLSIANAENRELRKGKSVAEVKVEEKERGEPSSELKGKQSGKPIRGVTTFDIRDAGVEF